MAYLKAGKAILATKIESHTQILSDENALLCEPTEEGFGAALAYRLGTGFAMIRKNGKLPPPTVSQEYSYEYASQVIEIGSTTLKEGARVVLVDDILATGGTMAASVKLLRRFSVHIVGISCIIEMTSMAGRDRLKQQTIHSVLTYH